MSRQKHYIKTYNEKDRQAYLFLNNIRHCKPNQLEIYISKNRISCYLKEHLIEKVKTLHGEYYKLTDKGYRTFEQKFIKENCKYHSQSPEHDCRLAQFYNELYIRFGPDNFVWKNEEDLKQERKLKLQEFSLNREYQRFELLRTASVSDCVVEFLDGSALAYDVFTANYSHFDELSKAQFADALHIPFNYDRI